MWAARNSPHDPACVRNPADLSDWLTTEQVADLLKVPARDVEHYLAGEGLKSRQSWGIEGQRPACVYDPSIVEAVQASFDNVSLETNPRLCDLVLNNQELHSVYTSLGYSPFLLDEIQRLASKVRACCWGCRGE